LLSSKSRIFISSNRITLTFSLLAYQRKSQSLMTPTRMPWGLTFCPIKLSPPLSLFRDRQGHVRSSLVDAVGAALSPGHHPLEDGAGGGEHLGHIELLNIHVEVILSIGHGALEELHHRLRGSLGGLHEDGHSGSHILTADQIGNDLNLAGSDAEIFQ